MVCVPLVDPLEFHVTVYGATVSCEPTLTAPTLNCTKATPTLSLALADRVTEADTVAAAVGAVIDTVGGVTSTIVVVNVKSPDTATLPDASVDRTRQR